MARRPFLTSDGLTELRTTKGALDQRWKFLSSQLQDILSLGAQQMRVDADAQADKIWAGFQGSACERVMRNRGGAANVVPLCALPKKLFAWLGLQEVWDVSTGPRPFIFNQISLTVHLGYVGDPVKPQAFRLEWPGVRDWRGAGLSFQTAGAGNPHWQIDILESLATFGKRETFETDAVEVVEDFEIEVTDLPIDDVLSTVTLESLHLASAAHWWLPKPADKFSLHANAPPDVPSLLHWCSQSVLYLQQELARCRLRA